MNLKTLLLSQSKKLSTLSALISIWILISFVLPRYFDAHNSFDHSWMTILSQPDLDYVFNYGPLSWIFLPDLNAIDLLKIILRFFICGAILAPTFETVLRSSLIRKLLIVFGFLLILAAPFFKYDILFYISFWSLTRRESFNSRFIYVSILLWTIVAPLYKFSFFPLAIILNLFAYLSNSDKKKLYLLNLVILTTSQIAIGGFLDRFELALNYSEYMAGYENWSSVTSVAVLLMALVIGIVIHKFQSGQSRFLLLFALFIQFKHSITIGTPGYAFYMFFIPMYFRALSFSGWIHNAVALSCLWMVPFYIQQMGGCLGLLAKFSNSLKFDPNLTIVINSEAQCSTGKIHYMLDDFGKMIGSPCALEAFPSVQFYGFSPESRVAKANAKYLNEKQPKEIYFSSNTFGKRNAISEISYVFDDLFRTYNLSKGNDHFLLSLKSKKRSEGFECSVERPSSQLVYLKLKCSNDFLNLGIKAQGILYKQPEIQLSIDNKKYRVFQSSLENGVYLYTGSYEEIATWWREPDQLRARDNDKASVEVINGAGFLGTYLEEELNKCLQILNCNFSPKAQK